MLEGMMPSNDSRIDKTAVDLAAAPHGQAPTLARAEDFVLYTTNNGVHGSCYRNNEDNPYIHQLVTKTDMLCRQY